MTGTTKLHMDGISRIKCNILFIVAGILCVPANVTAQFITISESSAMTAETPNKVAVESDAERRTYQADSSYYANRRRALEEVALTDSIVRPNESDDNHILYGNDLELRAALAAYFAMTDSLMMEYVKKSSQISIGYQSVMKQASTHAKKTGGKRILRASQRRTVCVYKPIGYHVIDGPQCYEGNNSSQYQASHCGIGAGDT